MKLPDLYRIPCCEGQEEPPLCPTCYGAGYFIVALPPDRKDERRGHEEDAKSNS